MPNRTALQVHLLAVPKRIAALCAPSTSWVKVMVFACLQHLAAYEPVAIGTLDTKRLLVALLTVRHPIFAHVLAVQHRATVLTPKAPHVPLPVQCDQRLPFLQLVPASCTVIRVVVVGLATSRHLGLVVGRDRGRPGWTRCGRHSFQRRRLAFIVGVVQRRNVLDLHLLLQHYGTSNARLAEHFLAGVGHLWTQIKKRQLK